MGACLRQCVYAHTLMFKSTEKIVMVKLSQTILLAWARQDSSGNNPLLEIDGGEGVLISRGCMFTLAHVGGEVF